MKKLLSILMISLFFVVGTSFLRGEEEKEQSELQGDFLLSYRAVDIGNNSNENKYKEDYNLFSGARLRTLNLDFQPKGALKSLFDNLGLSMDNFGGDPFETLHLNMTKYGKYTFNYKHLKSRYFYQDILFEGPLTYAQMRASDGGDFHHFNFDRVMDSADLKVWLSKNARLYLGFDRFSKKGNSTTTVDINRDEFEFDKPVDQAGKEITVGLDWSVKKFTIAFEEKIKQFKDANSYFLPGFSEGENYNYPQGYNYANLLYFFLDMPYDFTNYTHTVRLTAHPVKGLLLRASGSLLNLKMDNLDYSERARGNDYSNPPKPFIYDWGIGEFDLKRDIQLWDFDFSYLFNAKLALVGAFRYNDYEQEGMMSITANEVTLPAGFITMQPGGSSATATYQANEKYHTTGIDLGLQYQPLSRLTATAGFRNEQRTIQFETGRPDEKKKRTGLFGNIVWLPVKDVTITADYQFGDYTDPISAIAPSTHNRFRTTARCKFGKFFANVSYLMNRVKNDEPLYNPGIPQEPNSGWNSRVNQLNMRMGYGLKKFMISAGWAYISTKNTANNRLLNNSSASLPPISWPIYYKSDINLYDISIHWKIGNGWAIKGMVNYYTAPAYFGGYVDYITTPTSPKLVVDEGYKNWDMSRLIFKPFIEYEFKNGLVTQVSYWIVDFKDKPKELNSYKANIFEFSIGYRFD